MAKSDDQKALEAKIDFWIAEMRRLLHARYDKRGPVRPHDPERRSGFDRRARASPAKD